MAYTKATLSRVATMGAGGNSLWHYTSGDALAVIDTAAYFTGDAVGMLRVGDWILIAGASATFGIAIVLSNDGTTVDTSDAVAFGAVDAD